MPFTRLGTPSLGLSLLRPVLARFGVRSKILHLEIPFAERIGIRAYDAITEHGAHGDLMGEWVFSKALFGSSAPSADAYVHDVLTRYDEPFVRQTLAARDAVDGFLDACCADVMRHRPRIVGFSSVFQQHVPSLSLAKRIKSSAPGTFVVLGGANCEGVMGAETVRQFSFVDAVVSGEGEIVFPTLVQRVLEGTSVHEIAGVYTPESTTAGAVNSGFPRAPHVDDLDSLPFPDYDDYLDQYSRLRDSECDVRKAEMLLQTSRGCWWGQKRHCTFCGLSQESLVFRAKTPHRVVSELEHLIDRYSVEHVQAVDYILDKRYFEDLMPELAARRHGVTLFFEVRPDLTKEQLRLMRDAGIVSIQPGIESLSTPILKQMRKGSTALRNIQFLKWCTELGIKTSWMLLWAIPGESPEAFDSMSDLIPLLTHLDPPVSGSAIRLERFSPNFEDAEALGFSNLAPSKAYGHIYPLAEEAVANLAFLFTYDYQRAQDVEGYTKRLKETLAAWKRNHSAERLVMTDKGTHIEIVDTRSVALERDVHLRGLERAVHLACDQASTPRSVCRHHGCRDASSHEIEAILRSLVDRRLMITERGCYLSLAIDPFARVPVLRPKRVVATAGD